MGSVDALAEKGHERFGRTCIACGASRLKSDLVRFVRTADGATAIDPTGKAPGRGAYICPDGTCFATARKRNKLGAALHISIGADEYDTLERDFNDRCVSHTDAR